jgi:sulfoxide reductase catalytic subunit YedY
MGSKRGAAVLIRRPADILPSEITPRRSTQSRAQWMAGAGGLALAAALPEGLGAAPLSAARSPFSTDEKMTSREDVTSYNNYYEFGTGKGDPVAYAKALRTSPWTVKVDGMVAKPQSFGVEDLIKASALEERIYRMRCVEGWSMVIPWVGFPLADLIKRVEPLGSAKYVAFETAARPDEMPGLRSTFPVLDWPYVEGLRLDEAMHPLTIWRSGFTADPAEPERGPHSLVVPGNTASRASSRSPASASVEKRRKPPGTSRSWRIRLLCQRESERDHPRWSQATERRIGEADCS